MQGGVVEQSALDDPMVRDVDDVFRDLLWYINLLIEEEED